MELGGREIRAAIAEFVDVDGILAAQHEAGVERVLLCPWVPLLYYDADPDEGLRRARIQNEALAALVRARPERVAALGALPLQDPELAAGELRALMAGGSAARRRGGRQRARRVPRRRRLRALLGGGRGDRRARVRASDHPRLRVAGLPELLPLEHGGQPARDHHHGRAHGHGRSDGAPPRAACAAGPRRRRTAGAARAAAPRPRLPARGPRAPARVAGGLDPALLLRHPDARRGVAARADRLRGRRPRAARLRLPLRHGRCAPRGHGARAGPRANCRGGRARRQRRAAPRPRAARRGDR